MVSTEMLIQMDVFFITFLNKIFSVNKNVQICISQIINYLLYLQIKMSIVKYTHTQFLPEPWPTLIHLFNFAFGQCRE